MSTELSYKHWLGRYEGPKGGAESSLARRLRRTAYDRFKALDFPTRKMEGWKYMDLSPVLGASFALPAQSKSAGVDPRVLEPFALAGEIQHRIVLVNGLYSKKLSSVHNLPRGVILEDLEESLTGHEALLENYLGLGAAAESNAFASINAFSFKGGVFLYIPDKVVLEHPVHILSVAAGESGLPFAFYPRFCVVAGASTRLRLIVNEIGLGRSRYLSNSAMELYLSPGACVKYLEIRRSAPSSHVFSTNRFHLKQHGDLDVLTFTRGAASTRIEHEVLFEGEHGFASLKGLGVQEGDSQVFHHVTARHNVPRCISRQFYKNVLTGTARSEFNSLVAVAAGAVGSDSNQMTKSLLLSETARTWARPQLRIDNDDVSCTHGAAVGRLEKDELFYLLSRGFSKESARFLLTYGFLAELLEGVEPLGLREQLERSVKEALEGAVGGGH